MKRAVLFIIVHLAAVFATAQAPLPVGGKQLNAGLGLSSKGVPVYVGLDFGVHEDITVGGELSFRAYHEKWKKEYYRHLVTGISANGNYHFNRLLDISSRWDLYAGVNLGFFIYNSPRSYPGTRSSGLGLGGQIGARFFLNDKLGLNLEFGGGNAFEGGKFGVTVVL
jgi:outer membrane immunogenic protein